MIKSGQAAAGTSMPGPIRAWLHVLCLMIFAMILLGGATRLTDSGLSITEWQPIMGAIPPLSDADWRKAFDLYKQIPEYRLINHGMSLDEFKTIFWWEWAHRFLGRLIGVVFMLPFLVFWRMGIIPRPLMPRLLLMFGLGGLQGALGWYMVASGLVDRVDVSQYRLAAHFGLAVAILGYIFWTAQGAGQGRTPRGMLRLPASSARALAALIFLQLIAGAFVAGLDAGMGYTSWPLMDGAVIPSGLWTMQPWYLNLFENALTVQFDHRLIAYVIVLWAIFHAALVAPGAGSATVAAITLLQAALGVTTLLAQVPIALALAHQAGAVILFLATLAHIRRLT